MEFYFLKNISFRGLTFIGRFAKHIYPKTIAIKPDSHTYSYKFQSESLLIHPKILTRKSESVLIHFPKCRYYSLPGREIVVLPLALWQ